MPCSALKLPPNSRTRSWMARLRLLLDGLQLEGLRAGALVDVEVQVAVAQVAVRRRARPAECCCATQSPATSMKRGTCDTGTEMSCLRLAPSLRCASGMDSRSRQNASRSRSFCATAGVADPAGFERARQRLLEQRVERLVGARGRQFARARTTPTARPADRRRPGMCRVVSSTPMRGISSNEVTQSPLACAQRA